MTASFYGGCFISGSLNLTKYFHSSGIFFGKDEMSLFNLCGYFSSIFILIKSNYAEKIQNCQNDLDYDRLIHSNIGFSIGYIFENIIQKTDSGLYDKLFTKHDKVISDVKDILIGEVFYYYSEINKTYENINQISLLNQYFKSILEQLVKYGEEIITIEPLTDEINRYIEISQRVYMLNDDYIKLLYNLLILYYLLNDYNSIYKNNRKLKQIKRHIDSLYTHSDFLKTNSEFLVNKIVPILKDRVDIVSNINHYEFLTKYQEYKRYIDENIQTYNDRNIKILKILGISAHIATSNIPSTN